MTYDPTPADKLSSGLWTIGRVNQDPFGSASRAHSTWSEAVNTLTYMILNHPTSTNGDSHHE